MVFSFLSVALTFSLASAELSKTQNQNPVKDSISKQQAPVKSSEVIPAVSKKSQAQKNSVTTPKAVSKARGVILRLHLSANDKKR